MSLGSDAVADDNTVAIKAKYSAMSTNLIAVRNFCRDNKHATTLGLRNLQ